MGMPLAESSRRSRLLSLIAYYRNVGRRGVGDTFRVAHSQGLIAGTVLLVLGGLSTRALDASADVWQSLRGGLLAVGIMLLLLCLVQMLLAPWRLANDARALHGDGAELRDRQSAFADLVGAAIKRGEKLLGAESDGIVVAWSNAVARLIGQALGQGAEATYESNAGITNYTSGSPQSKRDNFVRNRVQRLTELSARLQNDGGPSVRPHFDPTEWLPPPFTATADLEPVPWQVVVNGAPYVHASVLWVMVENKGPTSTFTTRIPEIQGVPWGDKYQLIHPSWEQGPSHQVEVPHGGTARIKLAAILRQPRAFWFYTSQTGEQLPGNQWVLADNEMPDIRFSMEVVNTGDGDRVLRLLGCIEIPEDVTQATFLLAPELCAEPLASHPR